MAEVIWTEPALNALDAIAEHIALDDYDAVYRLVRNAFAAQRLTTLQSALFCGQKLAFAKLQEHGPRTC